MRSSLIVVVIIAAILAIISVYPFTLQPNIQVTDITIQSYQKEESIQVLDKGRVSTSGDFYHVAQQSGEYNLVFNNDFSIISTKNVRLSYTDNGRLYTESFKIPPVTKKTIPVSADSNQAIKGDFSVSGGSGNDVDFHIDLLTCTQTVRFSFTLLNNGPVNGISVVSLEADGKSIWSSNYLIELNSKVNKHEITSIPDCNQHDLKIVISEQKRA